MLIEKCDQRAQGDLCAFLYKMIEWKLGSLLAYGIPILSLGILIVFIWKNKHLLGWLVMISLQFIGSLLAIVLILQALMNASWGLW